MSEHPRRPISSRCDEQVWRRARTVARSMLATDPTYTLSDLLEAALTAECDRLEQAHGGPWPEITTDLRRGRRAS